MNFPFKNIKDRFKALPNFVIIGAMKSGTSSLFNYLAKHPQILPGQPKEVHYFDANFEKSEVWYRQHFPYKVKLLAGHITGEATPSYLYNPHVPKRLSRLLPRAKLIVILRSPTERAISHYFHEVRFKREPLPIMEAMKAEEDRIGQEWDTLMQDEEFRGFSYIHFSYKKRGLYLDQLERYWQYFDRSQILILDSVDFFTEPHMTLKKVFGFLDVNPDFEVSNLQPQNVGISKHDLPTELYDDLNQYFQPHNQRLYDSLGHDFGW